MDLGKLCVVLHFCASPEIFFFSQANYPAVVICFPSIVEAAVPSDQVAAPLQVLLKEKRVGGVDPIGASDLDVHAVRDELRSQQGLV